MSPKISSVSKRAKYVAKKGTSLAYRLVQRVKKELTRFGVGERVVNVVEETIHDVLDQEETATSSLPTKPKRSIPVTALDQHTVIRYFGLKGKQDFKEAPKTNKIWDIPEQHLLPVPQHLEVSMHEFDALTRFFDDSLRVPPEAMARSIIDQILSAAMREVRKELHNLASDNEEHLYLTMETRLEVTLSREDEDLVITGDADYSFWYGNPSDISTNLVVCEAKRKGDKAGLGGTHQLLGYMGIIHTMRRRLGKENCVVYGILTDTHTWWFYRIDNDSQVSEYVATWEYQASRIFSYICFILRAAYELTPTTSRITPSHRFSGESSYFNFDIFFNNLIEAGNLA